MRTILSVGAIVSSAAVALGVSGLVLRSDNTLSPEQKKIVVGVAGVAVVAVLVGSYGIIENS